MTSWVFSVIFDNRRMTCMSIKIKSKNIMLHYSVTMINYILFVEINFTCLFGIEIMISFALAQRPLICTFIFRKRMTAVLFWENRVSAGSFIGKGKGLYKRINLNIFCSQEGKICFICDTYIFGYYSFRTLGFVFYAQADHIDTINSSV